MKRFCLDCKKEVHPSNAEIHTCPDCRGTLVYEDETAYSCPPGKSFTAIPLMEFVNPDGDGSGRVWKHFWDRFSEEEKERYLSDLKQQAAKLKRRCVKCQKEADPSIEVCPDCGGDVAFVLRSDTCSDFARELVTLLVGDDFDSEGEDESTVNVLPESQN